MRMHVLLLPITLGVSLAPAQVVLLRDERVGSGSSGFPCSNSHWFQGAVRSVGDVDADGHADFLTTIHERASSQCVGQLPVASIDQHHTRIVSGADFTTIHSPDLDALYGIGDVNGDAHADFAHRVSNSSIDLLSGTDLGVLYSITAPMGTFFEDSIQALGDVNRDGRSDFVTVARGISSSSRVLVYSGRSGSLIHNLKGWIVAACGDLNADRAADLLIADPEARVALVLSGRDASLIHSFNDRRASQHIGVLGDIDADGVSDLVVGDNFRSGATGAILRAADGAGDIGDYDGDGYDDYTSGFQFLSGATGGLLLDLRTLVVSTRATVPFFESTRVGDLDHDGQIGIGFASLFPPFVGGVILLTSAQFRSSAVHWTRGIACQSSVGALPRIGLLGDASFGGTFDVTLAGGPPFASALLHIGDADRVPLDVVGAPGCDLLVRPWIAFVAGVDALGDAQRSLSLTPGIVPIDTRLDMQWIALDPGANALGVQLSDGLVVRAGH